MNKNAAMNFKPEESDVPTIVRKCRHCGAFIAQNAAQCTAHCKIRKPYLGRKVNDLLWWILSALLLAGFVVLPVFMGEICDLIFQRTG